LLTDIGIPRSLQSMVTSQPITITYVDVIFVENFMQITNGNDTTIKKSESSGKMWHEKPSTSKQYLANHKHQMLIFERLLARDMYGAAFLALDNAMQSLEKALTLEGNDSGTV